ncbi:MAG: PAS domain S-box protein [Candidatus Thorarchaeota archaeon]
MVTEEKLEARERVYISVFENMPNGFSLNKMVYDKKGRPQDYIFVEVNAAFEELTGFKSTDIIGKTTTEVFTEIKDNEFDWIGTYGKIVETGEPMVFEQYSDNLNRWFSVHAYRPFEDHFITLFTDVTRIKEAESKLSMFGKFVDASTQGFGMARLDAEILYVNPTLAQLIDLPDTESAVGRKFIDFLPKDIQKAVKEEVIPALMQKGHWTGELALASEKRGRIPTLEHFFIVNDDSGKPKWIADVVQDITVQKATENQTRMFESFVEKSTQGFAIANLEGEIQYLNPAMLQLVGIEDFESMNGRSFTKFIAEDYHEMYQEEVFPTLRETGRWSGETVLLSKTRGRVPVHEDIFTIPDEQGKPGLLAAVVTDSSEKKKAEEALRESEERYRSLYMGVPIALYRTDIKTGKVLECNQLGAELAGFESVEDATADFNPANHYANPDDRKKILTALAEHGEIHHYETQMQNDDGKRMWIEFSAKTHPEEGYVEFAVADITEKKDATDKLRESEHLYRTILDTLPNAVTVTDQTLKIATGNRMLAELQGVDSVDELVGLDGIEFIVPEDRERATEQSMMAIASDEIRSQEFTLIKRDGTKFPAEITASVVRDAEGNPTHFIAVSNDITERKAAEELQTVQHDLMTSLSCSLSLKDGVDLILGAALKAEGADSGGIYLVNQATGDIELVNNRGLSDEFLQHIKFLDASTPQSQLIQLGNPVYANFEEIPGVDDVQLREGLKSIAIIPIKHEDSVIAVLNIASHTHGEYPEQTRDYLETLSFQVGAVIARVKAEEGLEEAQNKLLRNERMAVLGRVSGGIGHELRNPLAAMKNATYYLRMVLEESDEDVQETLDILETEMKTSEMIITSLLDYARPKTPTRKKAELKDLVHTAMDRVRHREHIDVVQDFDSDIPILLVDPVQLTRTIINLARNAVQAMPDGGTLTFKGSAEESGWVSLSVSDTGVGMSEETMSHLFEPLYTTKAKGIGLGLVIIKSLVEAHGGTIVVESEEGKGSTFTVRLPVSKKEEN